MSRNLAYDLGSAKTALEWVLKIVETKELTPAEAMRVDVAREIFTELKGA